MLAEYRGVGRRTLTGALNSVANANGLVISVLLTVTFADAGIGEVLEMRHSV